MSVKGRRGAAVGDAMEQAGYDDWLVVRPIVQSLQSSGMLLITAEANSMCTSTTTFLLLLLLLLRIARTRVNDSTRRDLVQLARKNVS
jgi:hypothetical protein